MFFINPFIYGGAGGDFESIATVTVGSGGASSIEFTSIPGTYQHLQIRGVTRQNRSGRLSNGAPVRLNGDTASNYTSHLLIGDGTSASAGGYTSLTYMLLGISSAASSTSGVVAPWVMDILDYASTSKNKVVRSFAGIDNNGSTGAVGEGLQVRIGSGMWLSTSAVTSVTIVTDGAYSFVEHSTAALYGIKAP